MRYVNYMDLDFFQIRLFLSAARTLNFTRAAEECSVTQSTVSKSIKALESTLGMELFVRSRGRVELTPAGERLAEGLAGTYSSMVLAIESASRAYDDEGTSLVVGVPAAHYLGKWFDDALAELSRDGRTRVSVIEYEGPDIMDSLESGTCTLAIGFFDSFGFYRVPRP